MAAADYDLTSGADGKFQSHDLGFLILSKTLDFAKFTGTAASAGSKTADIITLPAGFVVENVFAKQITAGTAQAFTVGDADSATGFITTLNASSGTGITAADGAYILTDYATTPAVNNVWSGGKLYSTANAVRITLGATPVTTGVYQFVVKGYRAF